MKTIILDNKGETFDRYTIILPNGDCYGASENPFHPQGFGQYCGNIADNYYRVTYGYSWRGGCDEKLLMKRIKYAIDNYVEQRKVEEGEIQLKLSELPEEIQKYVKQLENEEVKQTIE